MAGCGLDWESKAGDGAGAQAASPAAAVAAPAAAGPADTGPNPDRDASPDILDVYDFAKWNVNKPQDIPWESMEFAGDDKLVSHAAAILFFLDPTLPELHPQLCASLHSG